MLTSTKPAAHMLFMYNDRSPNAREGAKRYRQTMVISKIIAQHNRISILNLLRKTSFMNRLNYSANQVNEPQSQIF
jgi:hypothetical protein